MRRSLDYICGTRDNFTFFSESAMPLNIYYLLFPFGISLQTLFIKRTGKPLSKIICRDITIF